MSSRPTTTAKSPRAISPIASARARRWPRRWKPGLSDLDGFYTFTMGTRDGFAVLRDGIACKPAVLAETDDWVAMASEFRSLANLPGVEKAKIWEPAPAVVYTWSLPKAGMITVDLADDQRARPQRAPAQAAAGHQRARLARASTRKGAHAIAAGLDAADRGRRSTAMSAITAPA